MDDDIVNKLLHCRCLHIQSLFAASCWTTELYRLAMKYAVSKTSHLWLAITLTHMNRFWYFLGEMLIFPCTIKSRSSLLALAHPGGPGKRAVKWLWWFGRNVTDKLSNQNTLYYAISNNLCFCTTWQNGETRKLHFSLKCYISALPEFNQLLLDFFNLFYSWLILTMLYDSLNLIINAFSSGLLGGMVQEKGSQECCSSWTVLHAQYTSVLSSGFPLSQGNTEALDKWGWKRKHHLISYFLSNTSAQKYCNQIMYVKITATKRWDVFETRCNYKSTCSKRIIQDR